MELIIFNNPIDILTNPEMYAKFSMVNYTPMLFISYLIDYYLFGYNPLFFYIHQLISLSIVAWLIFLILKKYNVLTAFLGSMIFIFSGPSSIVNLIMTRHYIEGSIFILLIFYTLINKKNVNILFISLLYFIACCYKEVYVPIFIIFPFFVEKKQKIRILLGCLFSLLIYSILRFYFLKSVGGYTSNYLNNINLSYVLNKIKTIFLNIIIGYDSIYYNILLILIICIILLYIYKSHQYLLSLLLIISLFLPIIPVLYSVQPHSILSMRLLLHISITMSLIFVLLFNQTLKIKIIHKNKKLLYIILIFIISILIKKHYLLLHNYIEPMLSHHSNENLFFYATNSTNVLISSSPPVHYWASLARIRQYLKNEKSPNVAQSPLIFTKNYDNKTFYCYENNSFHNCSKKVNKDIKDFFKNYKKQIPLFVDIVIKNGILKINLDKNINNNATYYLCLGYQSNYYFKINIGKQFTNKAIMYPNPYFIRIMKQLPDNKWVISEEWKIYINKNINIHWSNNY
jgi:hypothetical protein